MRNRRQQWPCRGEVPPKQCRRLDRVALPGDQPTNQQGVQQAPEGIDISGRRLRLAGRQPFRRYEADGLTQPQQRS